MVKLLTMKNFSFAILPLCIATGEDCASPSTSVAASLAGVGAVMAFPSTWTIDVEAGEAALLLPRRSLHTSLTPLNLESWNLFIAAAQVSSVL